MSLETIRKIEEPYFLLLLMHIGQYYMCVPDIVLTILLHRLGTNKKYQNDLPIRPHIP